MRWEVCLGWGVISPPLGLEIYFGYGTAAREVRLHLNSDTELAQDQEKWEEEQGGLEFLREVTLVSTQVAAQAAEWASLVAAQVRNLLVRPNRLEVARREAKNQLLRRRREAAARIRSRRRRR